ncbi:MAG: 2-amino-4-hydroxy-6-hydroxymethyldihydropteridine diphosphokinase, partial [Candidatus Peribacteraceae bacterium]|nr:2-amino-4-hydroxy-6-hydroxymethyldihydropteridine diphosphokinase [Candidatus Peribacteraceae bacterium]
QAEFLNAVGTFESEESPEAIKEMLESIESALGKSPPFRFGPRTIDLDILLFGELVLPDRSTWMARKRSAISDQRSEILTIPHLKIDKRRFVLEPLLELIDPETIHPVLGKPLSQSLSGILDQTCERTTIVL